MDRIPALSVAAGQPPTPFLNTGGFGVEWIGSLELQERRRLYFSFEGKGKASLSIDGEEVLAEEGDLGVSKSKRLRLNPGEHDISI